MRRKSTLLGLFLLSANLQTVAFAQNPSTDFQNSSTAVAPSEAVHKEIHKLVTPPEGCGLEPCHSVDHGAVKTRQSSELEAYLEQTRSQYKDLDKLGQEKPAFMSEIREPLFDLFSQINSTYFYIQSITGQKSRTASEILPLVLSLRHTLEELAATKNTLSDQSKETFRKDDKGELLSPLIILLHEGMKTFIDRLNQSSELKTYFSNSKNPGAVHYQNLKTTYSNF